MTHDPHGAGTSALTGWRMSAVFIVRGPETQGWRDRRAPTHHLLDSHAHPRIRPDPGRYSDDHDQMIRPLARPASMAATSPRRDGARRRRAVGPARTPYF
ncbi:hypothetical protein GCM10020219_048950 [Nonomuraea dietziae]